MLDLYQTPLDYLYLVLTVSIGLFTFLLLIALFHAIGILNNIKKVSARAKDTIDLVNHYLWQPIKIAMMIFEKGKEVAAEHVKKAAKGPKKK